MAHRKKPVVTKGSNVADAITSSGLMGASYGVSTPATAAQIQRELVGRSRPSTAASGDGRIRNRRPSSAINPSTAHHGGSGVVSTPLITEHRSMPSTSGGINKRPESAHQTSTAPLSSSLCNRSPVMQAWLGTGGHSAGQPGCIQDESHGKSDGHIDPTPLPLSTLDSAEDTGLAHSLREQELEMKLRLAQQQAASLETALGEARAAIQIKSRELDTAKNDIAVGAAEIRSTEARSATIESAKRNAERRNKSLEGEAAQLRAQLQDSRSQIDRLISEATESQKHWEKERAKHIDNLKKLRAEKKDEIRQIQADTTCQLQGVNSALECARRELDERDRIVLTLRQDLDEMREKVGVVTVARNRLEAEVGRLQGDLSASKAATNDAASNCPLFEAEKHPLVTAEADELKKSLLTERARSSELATALRKANRQVSESRERHANCLTELEERLNKLEIQHKDAVDSVAKGMGVVVERTTALLAGRKPGSDSTRRKQASGKFAGSSKSPAMQVLEDMNENLAAENALLLREVSRLQSFPTHNTEKADPMIVKAAVNAATQEAVVMHKHEILEDDLSVTDCNDESCNRTNAAAAIDAAAENLVLRMDMQQIKTEIANHKAQLHIATSEANAETERNRLQILDLQRELDAARKQNSDLKAEIEHLKAEWHPSQVVQEEHAKFESSKASLKAAKEEIERKTNALRALKAEKQQKDEQLDKEKHNVAKTHQELMDLKEDLRRKEAQVAKLKHLLTTAQSDMQSENGGSVVGRPSSAKPAASGGNNADYPRLRQQIASKDAEVARIKGDLQASAIEIDKLQVSLSKTKRQSSVKMQEKDARIKALEEDLRFTKETLGREVDERKQAAESAQFNAAKESAEVASLREELAQVTKEADVARIENEYMKQRAQKEKASKRKNSLGLCRAFSIGINP